MPCSLQTFFRLVKHIPSFFATSFAGSCGSELVLICLHTHIKRAELLIHTLSLLLLSRTIPTEQVSMGRSVGRVMRRAKRGTRVKACLITYITQIIINTTVSHIRSRQSHAPHSLNPNPRASALCSPLLCGNRSRTRHLHGGWAELTWRQARSSAADTCLGRLAACKPSAHTACPPPTMFTLSSY